MEIVGEKIVDTSARKMLVTMEDYQQEVQKVVTIAIKNDPARFSVLEEFQCKTVSNSIESDSFGMPDNDNIDLRDSSEEYKITEFDAVIELYNYLVEKGIFFSFLRFLLIEDQLNYNGATVFLREDNNLGTHLLREWWIRNDGTKVLKLVIAPVIKKLNSFQQPLELDPKRAKNSIRLSQKKVKKVVHDLISLLGSEFLNAVSPEFLDLIRFLNNSFGNKLNLPSSICLRLICPALVSAPTFFKGYCDEIPEITDDTQRSLVTVSKVLQRIANDSLFEEYDYMLAMNQFISFINPLWKSVFYKILVEGDLRISGSESPILEYSSKEFYEDPGDYPKFEDINDLLTIENREWEIIRHDDYVVRITQSKNNMIMCNVVKENIHNPYDVVHDWLVKNFRTQNPRVKHFEIVEQIEENERISYCVEEASSALFSKRESLYIEHWEDKKKDQIAYIISRATERDNFPMQKKYVKSMQFQGYLIRGCPDQISSVSYFLYFSPEVSTKFIPQKLMNKAIKEELCYFKGLFQAMEKIQA